MAARRARPGGGRHLAGHPLSTRPVRSHGPVLPGLLVTALLLAGVIAPAPRRRDGPGARDLRPRRRPAPRDPRVRRGRGVLRLRRDPARQRRPGGLQPVPRRSPTSSTPRARPTTGSRSSTTPSRRPAGPADWSSPTRARPTPAPRRTTTASSPTSPPPVLVAWATPEEVPARSKGDVIGLGGSAAYEPRARAAAVRHRRADPRPRPVRRHRDWIPGAREPLEAVVLHELGHLVGLAHVDDTGELMHPTNTRTSFGPGDLEGLARLGDTPWLRRVSGLAFETCRTTPSAPAPTRPSASTPSVTCRSTRRAGPATAPRSSARWWPRGCWPTGSGVDYLGLGEHHRADYAISAPDVVLAAIAGQTERIRLGTGVTVLSSDDPIRVYQRFATLDAIAPGRAEVQLGRGSFIESFGLFGLSPRRLRPALRREARPLLRAPVRAAGHVAGHHPPTPGGQAGLPDDGGRPAARVDRASAGRRSRSSGPPTTACRWCSP